MKKLLIVGASILQLPAIKKAKALSPGSPNRGFMRKDRYLVILEAIPLFTRMEVPT